MVNNYPMVLSIAPLSNPQMHELIALQKRQEIYMGVNHNTKINQKKGEEKKKIHYFWYCYIPPDPRGLEKLRSYK
jgi:hypothetical protein